MSSNIPEIKDIKSVIEKHLGQNVEVLKMNTKMLTAPGENYGSVMLAVDMTIKIGNEEPKPLHLVAKLCPANEILCELFNIQITFRIEMGMYLDVIPALEKFQEEYGGKDIKFGDLFAKSYGGRASLSPDSKKVDQDAVILLENLKIMGYDVADRLSGFDLEHIQLVLKNLARFHAVPIALRLLKPDIFEEKVRQTIKKNKLFENLAEHTPGMIAEIVDILKTRKEIVPYLDKIEEFTKYHLTGPYRLDEFEGPFATIVHSDFWVNNTMILKDKSGKPIHNKIVDLQLPMYNTLVYDLLFVLYSSTQPSVLHKNLDNLIKLYHESFIKCLDEFKVDLTPFSWEAFNKEIAENAAKELGHILVMFKPILTLRGEIKDMSKLDEDELVNQKKQLAPDFEQRIIDTVLSYIDKKWL